MEPRDLFATAGARRQKHYARERKRYRARHPDRNFAIDERAVFLAPPELRIELAEERE